MIEGKHKRLVITVFLLVAPFLVACTEDDGTDYCKNHYLFHADHMDSIGSLEAELSAKGLLAVGLNLPYAALARDEAGQNRDSLLESILQPGNVFSITSDHDCGPMTATGGAGTTGFEVEYESDCGAGNRIEQVNVLLFDLLRDLDEVKVSVTTPAAAKHFAISRQCDAAIFRLQNPGGKD